MPAALMVLCTLSARRQYVLDLFCTPAQATLTVTPAVLAAAAAEGARQVPAQRVFTYRHLGENQENVKEVQFWLKSRLQPGTIASLGSVVPEG